MSRLEAANLIMCSANIPKQFFPSNLSWYTVACLVQPDTFEAVRINVFNMLAELAQALNEEQLEFFSRSLSQVHRLFLMQS